MKRPVCPCPYCDPLLWTQAHSEAAMTSRGGVSWKAANAVALLGRLVEHALHPEHPLSEGRDGDPV